MGDLERELNAPLPGRSSERMMRDLSGAATFVGIK